MGSTLVRERGLDSKKTNYSWHIAFNCIEEEENIVESAMMIIRKCYSYFDGEHYKIGMYT